MESKVKVSILMPTYNHKKYVKKAIESVLRQNILMSY
jgi:glycosyltransferase involved in cell wall biosynthesis